MKYFLAVLLAPIFIYEITLVLPEEKTYTQEQIENIKDSRSDNFCATCEHDSEDPNM